MAWQRPHVGCTSSAVLHFMSSLVLLVELRDVQSKVIAWPFAHFGLLALYCFALSCEARRPCNSMSCY